MASNATCSRVELQWEYLVTVTYTDSQASWHGKSVVYQ